MKNFSLQKMNKRLIILIAFLVLIFFILQMFITNSIGTKSSEIQSLRLEKAALRTQNEIISSEIDKLKTLDQLKQNLENLGLTEKVIQYLDEVDENSLASN